MRQKYNYTNIWYYRISGTQQKHGHTTRVIVEIQIFQELPKYLDFFLVFVMHFWNDPRKYSNQTFDLEWPNIWVKTLLNIWISRHYRKIQIFGNQIFGSNIFLIFACHAHEIQLIYRKRSLITKLNFRILFMMSKFEFRWWI